jgi:hypothetical protein
MESRIPNTAIQNDVAQAFSVRPDRVFHRKNAQVYAIVGTNPEEGLISDVWFDRYDDPEEFRAVLGHIRTRFEGGGYRYWLADLRFLSTDFSNSEDWLVKELMPAVIGAGLVREAVVLSPGAIESEGADVTATASRALRDIADGRVRGFTDIAVAKRWLFDGALPE